MEEIINSINLCLKENFDKIFIIENNEKFSYKDLYNFENEIDSKLSPFLLENHKQNIIKFSYGSIFSFTAFYLFSIKKNLSIQPIRGQNAKTNIKLWYKNKDINLYIDLNNNKNTPFNEPTFIINSSGSTGEPKNVFLSHERLYKSFTAISKYMKTKKSDIHAWSMPPDYVYGLSMLNQVLFTQSSAYIINPNIPLTELIKDLKNYRINKIYGVPSGIKPIVKYGSESLPLSLESIFIAGGRCDYELSILLEKLNKKICIMYGCTEASARLTYIYNDFNKIREGCVGKPIEGVDLKIVLPKDLKLKDSDTEEIIYGDVMFKSKYSLLGYTTDTKSYECSINQWIPTGDIGYIKNNNLFITGRKARFAKIGGIKISLNKIEDFLLKVFNNSELACIRKDNFTDTDEVYCFIKTKLEEKKLRSIFLDFCKNNNQYPSWRISIKFIKCALIQKNKNGKTDYKLLERDLK